MQPRDRAFSTMEKALSEEHVYQLNPVSLELPSTGLTPP